MIRFNTANIKGDLFGGLTAGVVALPLALAMGVASGLGPIAGMYGAIFVGFFAALFGGTEPQVSGPTGPMTVVLAGLVASLAVHPDLAGDTSLIFTAIIMAGVIQILLGILKLGEYIRLVPYPVISGFMSGIGGIIIILQISPLLGHEAPAGTIDALLYAPTAAGDMNVRALGLGAITLLIAMKWPRSLAKYLPGPLAALIIGTLISVVMGGIPILGDIPSGLPQFHMPIISREAFFIVGEAALVLALLGAIDSLLTSLVADNMTRSRHDSNQELIGQGIGNTVAGLFGGAAGAGATMRTVVNIRTGGKTRISGMTHALVLLAIVLGLGPMASVIPHSVLAGILIKVGVDIIDWSYLKNAHRGPRWDLALMLLVFGLTVFVDLITAVAVGVILASIAFVRQVAREQVDRLRTIHTIRHTATPRELELMNETGNLLTIFDFSGPLSFGAAADLGHHARTYFEGGTLALILDFSRVPFLDVSSALAVETIANDAAHSKRRVYMCGMNEQVRSVLEALEANKHLHDAHSFDTREEAMEAAAQGIRELKSGSTHTKNAA
ncbi:MAG: SulP family inorganic anion transporter [Pseudomonadales bacterium]|nr:SulP family inorganic anion transporter [Pseudomonadales bacterium]